MSEAKEAKRVLTLGICPSSEGNNIYPFEVVFQKKKFLYGPEGLDDCSAVILWGGTDIAPTYYNETPHPMNQQQKGPSARDIFEWSIIKGAIECKIPLIGICRGGQFLTVAAGGSLVQHMAKSHHGLHEIWATGQKMEAACDHHQAFVINDVPDAALFAYAKDGTPEVVYFPSINALAIQPHPEWMSRTTPFVNWCVDKVEQLVNKNLIQEIAA